MSETRYPPDRPFRSLTENLVRRGNETSTLVANVPNFLSREECARVVAAAERAKVEARAHAAEVKERARLERERRANPSLAEQMTRQVAAVYG